MLAEDLFRALGDDVRLEIIRRLSSGHPHNLRTISSGFEISRQGVRKHLQVLEEANIVILQPRGRETSVLLDRKALVCARDFIAELERCWDNRLENLRDYVENPTEQKADS